MVWFGHTFFRHIERKILDDAMSTDFAVLNIYISGLRQVDSRPEDFSYYSGHFLIEHHHIPLPPPKEITM